MRPIPKAMETKAKMQLLLHRLCQAVLHQRLRGGGCLLVSEAWTWEIQTGTSTGSARLCCIRHRLGDRHATLFSAA